MRSIILLIFITIASNLGAQENIAFPVIKVADKFDFGMVEKKVPRTVVTKFIKEHPGNFSAYRHPDMYMTNIDSLIHAFIL